MQLPILLALLAALTLSAPAHATPNPTAAAANQIAWFDGSVDEAFDEAALQHKPLFLYWGAVWCPPCNELKRTIFQRPEFVARTRDFVPVYLDGDSERAQRWGEYFAIVGYPTVVILAPDRRELTRIPGDLDIARYAEVLDLARGQLAPVRELVTRAQTQPASLSEDDWKRLGYYAWDEDEGRTVPAEQLTTTLRQLADGCPTRYAEPASRLRLAWLVALLTEDEHARLDADTRRSTLAQIQTVLASPELSRSNAPTLIWAASDIVAALTDAGPARTALERDWNKTLDRLADDDKLSTMHRLATVDARLELAKLDHPGAPPPAALVALAKKQVAWADKKTTEPHERQSVINAANKVLIAAGLRKDAERLLTAELQRSPAPYYFMLDLADLARETGDTTRALDWLKRAWDGAQGPATRFQWGVSYVRGLVEMKPDDRATIAQATTQLLKELDAHPDALHQRTRARFDKLGKQLADWGRQHDGGATLKTLRAQIAPLCTRLPASDADARRSCDGFLASAA